MSWKIQCSTCGEKVAPKREDTVQERINVVGAVFQGGYRFLDVMDCPVCGCQIILTERLYLGTESPSELQETSGDEANFAEEVSDQ